ncbi:helix-turn-helix transcriptional regulator [Rhizorhabdus wittichii DC-6]|jgi:DNA-binding CsgD family transcriptional regulator|uniref:Sigma-70, region 4 type 2 n=2 Tax=Rhizorhabdus wittichii TaxID=160791 RepID=A0A9J9LF51_RHIWR|nr:helix-turn-helix transcriptional regulator [Rhizorhabdus wittichii]ABQ69528.1 Sigma-70, region 4 type 2 [Rhizorhabdus wittichii RW1]ARR57133.1 helix-turn-helix transcriptional regulator [Rhizorhabdus wittichii DC-6]QTH24611.1 helix-turn-helix transcriptional regulator [Rhizorhabdus wittichii]
MLALVSDFTQSRIVDMIGAMESDRIEKLTEAQRVCLRMVLMHLSSKDIARELGISPHTVDQRLRMAIQALGVANRFEAARILAKYETPNAYQSAVYQSSHVAPQPVHATVGLSDIHGVRQDDNGYHGSAVREEQIAFRTPAFATGGFVNLPIPTPGRERNDLSIVQRLGWIVSIAIASALAFGGLLAGLDALKRLFQA